jgi:hypothetical protein
MEQIIGEPRAGLDEMLTIIEDEQKFFITQIIHDEIRQRIKRQFLQAKDLCQCGGDLRRVAERRKFNEPDAMLEICEFLCADFL